MTSCTTTPGSAPESTLESTLESTPESTLESTPESTPESTLEERTSGDAGQPGTGRGSLRRSRLSLLFLALVAALALGGVTATPASADAVIGGSSSGPNLSGAAHPSAVHVGVVCRTNWSGNGTIQITPFVAVQSGWTNGQYMSYRYQLRGSNGYSGTSAWSASTLVPGRSSAGLYPYKMLPATSITGARLTNWTVLVQVGYHTSRGWVYSGWIAPTGYSHGGPAIYGNCTT